MANPKALAFKEKGNVAFKAGDFPTAIGHYTSAILADRNDVTFPLNRAAAYLKLGKFEDAERDCNTVLKLSSPKINVKALFRRGQARVGMGKLLEAQKDFSDVLLQEPSNASAAEELKTVTSLIQKEKAKKSKSTAVSIPPPSTSNGVQVKRRRVPIRIVGDTPDTQSGSTSTSTSSKAVPATTPASGSASTPSTAAESSNGAHTPKTTTSTANSKPAQARSPQAPNLSSTSKDSPNSAIDTLQAVSSRSLKSPPPSSASAPKATTSSSPALAPTSVPNPASSPVSSPPFAPSLPPSTTSSTTAPPPPSAAHPSKPDSFKDAKQARESKTKSANTKLLRVGGGIFRASGANTIFATRGGVEEGVVGEGENAAGAKGEGVAARKDSGEAVSLDDSAKESIPAPVPAREQTPAPAPAKTSTPSERPGPPPTLFEFSKTWYGIQDSWERWEFMNTVTPAQLPALCKTSLEPSLLVSILDVFLTVLTSPPPSANSDNIKMRVQEYMENLKRIPRFSTLVLFLSKPEKEVAREVWRGLGVDRPVGVWKAVSSA